MVLHAELGSETVRRNGASLAGKHVAVVGGTGEVGEGIVRQLLAAGARVTVPARSQAKASLLRDRIGPDERLSIIEHGFSSVQEAEGLAAATARSGAVDGVVASIGSFWSGPTLITVEPGEWDRLVAASLTPHYAVARAFHPFLRHRPGGTYVQIAGAAGVHPLPGSSLMCVTAAGVIMIGRQLAAEHTAEGDPRYLQLRIDALVKTRSQPEEGTYRVTADGVGAAVVGLLSRDIEPSDGRTLVLA
jgi:NAD(P)-dependent dehydrogenase (short-subunit alcohol dehydrogenase family)